MPELHVFEFFLHISSFTVSMAAKWFYLDSSDTFLGACLLKFVDVSAPF